jgi:hypothetical protein
MKRKGMLGLCLGVVLAFGGIATEAASGAKSNCRVVSGGASFGTLQAAVDAAASGATLTVTGTCYGDTLVTKNLTIVGQTNEGHGAGQAILDGGNHGEVNPGTSLTVEGGAAVTVIRVTITGGQTETGAGVVNDGTLRLEHATVAGNAAQCFFFCGGPGATGGGIANDGSLTLDHSTVTHNSAEADGGGIWNGGQVTLDHSIISENEASDGAGIMNYEAGLAPVSVTLNDSEVSANTATGGGGGIANTTGLITLNHSTVSDNSAGFIGGGIWNFSILRIIGKHPGPKGTVTLDHSAVTDNTVQGHGGGIGNWEGPLTLHDSTVSRNTAIDGGGISNEEEGSLTLDGSSAVTRNAASDHGGGIYNEESRGATITFGTGWTGRLDGNRPDDIFTA